MGTPKPTPTPGLTPTPPPPGSGKHDGPQPTPSPSPNPAPAPWGGDPDVGVSSSWLRSRAGDCDDAAEAVGKTMGPSKEAFEALPKAASGWQFAKSIDAMQGRWEKLNALVKGRAATAAENFRLSAGAFDQTEQQRVQDFHGVRPPN